MSAATAEASVPRVGENIMTVGGRNRKPVSLKRVHRDLDSMLHCTDMAICRSLKKRKRKHGMSDMREKSSVLLPDHSLDMMLIMNESSGSSSSCSLTDAPATTSAAASPCNIQTSNEILRITDRLLNADHVDDKVGSGGGNSGKHQPLLQITLLPHEFSIKLLPVSSTSTKVNGNNNNISRGSEGCEVFLPYDEGCSIIQDIDNGLTPVVLLDYLMAKYPSRLGHDDYGQEVDILLKDLRISPDSGTSSNNNHVTQAPESTTSASNATTNSSSCINNSTNNIVRHVRLKSTNLTINKILHHKIMSQQIHRHRTHHSSPSTITSPSPASSSLSSPSKASFRNQTLPQTHQQQANQLFNHDNHSNKESASDTSSMDGMSIQMNGHLIKQEEESSSRSSFSIPIKSEPETPPPVTTTPAATVPNTKTKGRSRSKSGAKDKESANSGLSLWDQDTDEMDQIESQIIHKSSPSALCLDPSPVVHLIHNRLSCAGLHRKEIFPATSGCRKALLLERRKRMQLLKSMRRSSTTGLPQDDQLDQEEEERLFLASNPHLKLSSFLSKRQKRASLSADKKPATAVSGKSLRKSSTSSSVPVTTETKLDMEKVSEEINRLSSKFKNMCAHLARTNEVPTLTKVEELVMEYDSSSNSGTCIPSVTCVSIFHRTLDDVFFGQLFVDRPGTTGSSSRSCLYKLGNRDAAKKYLEQFREILTENGRKAVRITRTNGSNGVVNTSSGGNNNATASCSSFVAGASGQQQQQLPQQQQLQHQPQQQQQISNSAHFVANSNLNLNCNIPPSSSPSPSCVTNPSSHPSLQTIVNSLNQQHAQHSFHPTGGNNNTTNSGNISISMNNSQAGAVPAGHSFPPGTMVISNNKIVSQQQRIQQIHLQGQPQQQIATKVILPPVVQAGVDQMIQQQQQAAQQQQQFRIQPQVAGQKIQIQQQQQAHIVSQQQVNSAGSATTGGMICTMIPNNASTLQAVLTQVAAAGAQQSNSTGTGFNQQIAVATSTHLPHGQHAQVTSGTTTTQLRSIPGTNSWLVLPPQNSTPAASGSQAQVTAQTGQGSIVQQQQVQQQQPASGYRPVHVILWPQQQPPAAPAQHHIVNSNASSTTTSTLVTTTSSSVPTPGMTVSLLSAAGVNAGSAAAAMIHHQQVPHQQPQVLMQQINSGQSSQ